eukprot:5054227-Pyramimonas_sp.AAC.1
MLLIRTGHPELVTVVAFDLFWLEYRGSLRREPRLRVTCKEISDGSPHSMGPALHVGSPSGSSGTCNCRHFWAPQA